MSVSTRVRELVTQGDRLFTKRQPILSLWQTMAENFYPMRADFTSTRAVGEEFASNLFTGRPVLAHRDLGNSLSAMLRPRGTAWFHARTNDEKINNDASARQWLDGKSEIMRRIMYDQRAQFIRATKQGDNDFVAFGQCVISVDPNRFLDGALYRAWHLKDVAWCENSELVIDTVHRNWSLEARSLVKLFPKTATGKLADIAKKDPYREIKCRHIMIPEDEYDLSVEKKGRTNRLPFTSIYIDTEHDIILEEVPAKRIQYVIPRWVTVSGSQYAHSPATVTSLPDARMLQQITMTLLEAGQNAVNPPLKATAEAIQGGVNAYPGAITWVDAEYDERTGAALESLYDTSKANLNWGDAREEKIERMISEAFFLNVINLPETTGAEKMTAYETQKRVEEYIRRALPLFEPMEVEYNGGLCEQTWNLAMDFNAFGAFDDMPDVLKGREIAWQFESPLQAANDRVKAQSFAQASQMLAEAAQIDPSVRHDFNLNKAFRDALGGIAPADWIMSEKDAAMGRAKDAQQAQLAEAAHAMATGADVATRMGKAGQAAGDAAVSIREGFAA